MDKSDAEYVECLHTSTDCYGIKGAYCHSDFYANYGSNQPGCLTKIGSNLLFNYLFNLNHNFNFTISEYREFDCDHYRAYEIYAESISSSWSFGALKCAGLTTSVCSYKESEHFGGYPTNLGSGVNGIYIFFTNKEYPYRQASPFDLPEF